VVVLVEISVEVVGVVVVAVIVVVVVVVGGAVVVVVPTPVPQLGWQGSGVTGRVGGAVVLVVGMGLAGAVRVGAVRVGLVLGGRVLVLGAQFGWHGSGLDAMVVAGADTVSAVVCGGGVAGTDARVVDVEDDEDAARGR
jgi:hypothetical protein